MQTPLQQLHRKRSLTLPLASHSTSTAHIDDAMKGVYVWGGKKLLEPSMKNLGMFLGKKVISIASSYHFLVATENVRRG
jgi:hypothetical protein